MFHNNKFVLILLLFTLPLISNCSVNKPESVGKLTELDVIFDPNLDFINENQIESSILKFQIRGIREPIFELLSIHSKQLQKMPRGRNLLILLKSGSPLFNSQFSRLFDPQFINSIKSSNKPLTLIKDDLFHHGQRVYILINGEKIPEPSVYLETLSQLNNKIATSVLKLIMKESEEDFDNELSDTLLVRYGINANIPKGFISSSSNSIDRTILLRRGVGTKTEEWISISELDQSKILTVKGTELKSFRDKQVSQLLQFSDGSIMTTNSAVLVNTVGDRFRGEWSTSPYPMAGVYSAKIVTSGKRKYYIEAGIYSPGRSKTLNLLRLENSLYFNR